MPFSTPSFDELKARYLQTIANQVPGASVGVDSDHAVRAAAVAAVVESLHEHQWWISRQRFATTADSEFLAMLASERGLVRRPAVAAAGLVRVAGTVGSAASLGQQLLSPSGVVYELTANALIGPTGTVDVSARALVAGLDGETAANTALTLNTPAVGLTGALVISMDGGQAEEDDESLRVRLLEVMRSGPAGGALADYRRWALEVPGVARAFVFGNRRTLGAVDVAILAPNGVAPSIELIEAVSSYIEQKRPVTAAVLVLQPTFVQIEVTATVQLAGVSLSGAQTQARAAIAAYFETLEPGQSVSASQLTAAIQNVPGVLDVHLTAPAANVATVLDATHLELAVVGSVTLVV